MEKKISCLIIAGEKSGEEHAMSFLPELIKRNPQIHFFGVGGQDFKSLGVELLYHLKDFSVMGFSEVIGRLRFYLKALNDIENEVSRRNCQVAILIDFQTFNLKLATRLREQGVAVLYYVAPQAWSWKEWRVRPLAKSVHTLFTIIPFEKKWFLDRGVTQVRSVVHPLLLKYESILPAVNSRTFPQDKIHLLILPGSRNQEVQSMLPIYIDAVRLLKEAGHHLFVSIVTVDSVKNENYAPFLTHFDKVYNSDELNDAMKAADICVATSGTVTLATGLFSLPTVVCYKMGWFNYLIVKLFVHYKGPMSLTNIVHSEFVFPEHFQKNVTAANIKLELEKWINNKEQFYKTVKKLDETRNLLKGDDFEVPLYMEQAINEAYKDKVC